MSENADAIQKGVYYWLDANKELIAGLISEVPDKMAAGAMLAIGKFLEQNKDDMLTAIAGAIALSWASKQHPLPRGAENN